MNRSRTSSQPIRKLTKSGGNSYYVTIPLDYIRNLKWHKRPTLVIEQKGEEIVIKDWKK